MATQIKSQVKMCGIYKIVNKITGKLYVGSSIDIRRRWQGHKRGLILNKNISSHLQASWNKYGETEFEFVIIEQCSKIKLIKREQYWIDFFDSTNPEKGYNVRPSADSNLGVKHTEKAKEKISCSMQGKNVGVENPMFGRFGSKHPTFGRKHSKEAKEKMRQVKLGVTLSEETKKKISKALSGENCFWFGKHPTEEMIEKNRQAHLGRIVSNETREKLRQAALRQWSRRT